MDQAKTSFIPRAHNAKILGFVYGMFFIGTFLKESMLECLPVGRVPGMTSVTGRLIVVMSSLLGWGSIRAKEFDNGQELIDALRCSCAIFPLVMPHRFRGKRCFDGFFSEGTSAPTLDDEEAAVRKTVYLMYQIDQIDQIDQTGQAGQMDQTGHMDQAFQTNHTDQIDVYIRRIRTR